MNLKPSNTQLVLLDRLSSGWTITAATAFMPADLSLGMTTYRRAVPQQQLASMVRKGLIKFSTWRKAWIPTAIGNAALSTLSTQTRMAS